MTRSVVVLTSRPVKVVTQTGAVEEIGRICLNLTLAVSVGAVGKTVGNVSSIISKKHLYECLICQVICSRICAVENELTVGYRYDTIY